MGTEGGILSTQSGYFGTNWTLVQWNGAARRVLSQQHKNNSTVLWPMQMSSFLPRNPASLCRLLTAPPIKLSLRPKASTVRSPFSRQTTLLPPLSFLSSWSHRFTASTAGVLTGVVVPTTHCEEEGHDDDNKPTKQGRPTISTKTARPDDLKHLSMADPVNIECEECMWIGVLFSGAVSVYFAYLAYEDWYLLDFSKHHSSEAYYKSAVKTKRRNAKWLMGCSVAAAMLGAYRYHMGYKH